MITSRRNIPHCTNFPDPEDDGYTREYTAYIKQYVDDVFLAVKQKDFEKVSERVDIDSFIEGHLMETVTRNIDSFKASMYFYLPAGGKLTYGPVWDMDITFGYTGSSSQGAMAWIRDFQDNFLRNELFHQMMKIPEFKELYKARFFELYDGLEDFLDSTIDDIAETYRDELANEFENKRSWIRYGNPEANSADDFDAQIDYMKRWTKERLEALYELYSA